MERPPRYAALTKVIEIAHQLGARDPESARVIQQIIFAVAEARLEDRPRPIETAPRVPRDIVLLYCPNQGGWQTGEWDPNKSRWLANMNLEILHPTHWAEIPKDPQET